ncbi:MAG TPA: sulfite exporter TauE/SafE family protein [Xanthobacteraceae bacterium]|nr:sulfite exporter TauE/SafE family protein [Xanthobacteraceae bacterium]
MRVSLCGTVFVIHMFDFGIGDHSRGALVLLAVSAFLAAIARGFSGFGSALIFVPLASTAIGPQAAAPLLLIIDGVAAAGLIPSAWRHADRRDAGTMSIGALAGIPLGAWVLIKSDPLWIRWAIAVFGTLLLALLMSGWRYRGKPTAAITVGVGAVAGLLGGAAQVGGPPIVAYWLSRPIPAETIRANIVLYFAIATMISATAYLAGGLLTSSVIGLALVTGPIYALGLYAGSRIFGLASELTFRRICFVLIAVAIILSLPALDGIGH